MARKAFCVGINDYPYDGSDLKGCVNDAHAWAGVLTELFGFQPADVRVLTDAQATKKKVVDGIKQLLAKSKAGDVLVFTTSSHGTYVADKSGDEPAYDEAICPYDVADNLIVDDELRAIFHDLKDGVHLTVISDSCFSGTVTRAAVGENIPGLRTPDDRRVRFLNPGLRGGKVISNPWAARPRRYEKYPESGMRELLLSGSNDHEYSYDADIGGTYHGAMTYHAVKAIRDAGGKLTYAQLHDRLVRLLDQAGYPQHPQLEGKAASKRRQLFS